MDAIGSILQAPINTILILAGIVFAFFGIFEISKGSVRLRAGQTNFVPLILGGVLIVVGVLLKPGSTGTKPSQATPAAVETAVNTPTDVPPTQPAAATEGPAVSTATSLPQPTATTQVKTLADGCFSASKWKAQSINSEALKSVSTQDNCLNLNSLGVSAEQGGKIRLLATAPKAKSASGVAIPVTDQSVIDFKLSIGSLYIIYPDEAVYVSFGIAPADNQLAERGAGRFKLVVDRTGNEQTVFYYLANAEQSFGSKWPSQHPSYNRVYAIRLVLKSISMEIYVDGNKLKDEVTLPPGTKVFNMGYYLPVQAGTDISISELTIDGVVP